MTIVLTILMIIGIIISVILITALILPKKYKVLREVTIQQPQQKVFDYIKYIRNQDGFSVWANTDPNMKKTYSLAKCDCIIKHIRHISHICCIPVSGNARK